MKIMRSIKGISVFLTLAVSLLASTIGAQAQISSGAPTKLVLINSFNDFASVQPAQNQNSVVVVRYGNTVGDQLGGMFAYDPDSVAAGDSKNVFVPASGVGRFVRYDYAAYVPGVNTANRVLVTDGSGNVGTDPQLTFNGADLTVGGNLTVTTIGAGGTDNVVTKSAGNVLQTRQVNPDVWNLAADLAGDSENLSAGTKLTSPAIYFDGSNGLEVADSDKLSFQTATGAYQGTWSAATNTPFLTDGVGTSTHYYVVTAAGTQNLGSGAITYAIGDTIKYDGSIWSLQQKDDLPFSVSAWIKMNDATSNGIISKYGTTTATAEWTLYTGSDDKLYFQVQTAGTVNTAYINTDVLTAYEGQWIHIAAAYGGAGPNSATAFTAAASAGNMEIYLNGALQSVTRASGASFAGTANTSQAVMVGRASSRYMKGHISNVQIYNKELTADEVAQLARGNDLGFADEWGGALGGVYTQDSTPSGEWTGINATDADVAGPIGGVSNVLGLTMTAGAGVHYMRSATLLAPGKRYRMSFRYYVPSGQSNVDGISVVVGTSSIITLIPAATATLNTWNTVSFEFKNTATANAEHIYIYGCDGASIAFDDTGGDDKIYVDGLTITQLGNLADFRAENFDSDTGKIYDLSSNGFVGTSANLPTLTGRAYPVYETGTWTPSITFGGGSTGVTYTTQEGYYTRIGNIVHISCSLTLSNKGTDTGGMKITGIPFTASNLTDSQDSLSVGFVANMSGLTSALTALMGENTTNISLYDWGATGGAEITEANATNTTTIRMSGTYQIQ